MVNRLTEVVVTSAWVVCSMNLVPCSLVNKTADLLILCYKGNMLCSQPSHPIGNRMFQPFAVLPLNKCFAITMFQPLSANIWLQTLFSIVFNHYLSINTLVCGQVTFISSTWMEDCVNISNKILQKHYTSWLERHLTSHFRPLPALFPLHSPPLCAPLTFHWTL